MNEEWTEGSFTWASWAGHLDRQTRGRTTAQARGAPSRGPTLTYLLPSPGSADPSAWYFLRFSSRWHSKRPQAAASSSSSRSRSRSRPDPRTQTPLRSQARSPGCDHRRAEAAPTRAWRRRELLEAHGGHGPVRSGVLQGPRRPGSLIPSR